MNQINMAVFFWYIVKKGLVQCTPLYACTLDKSLFTRYQKHTAMLNHGHPVEKQKNLTGSVEHSVNV